MENWPVTTKAETRSSIVLSLCTASTQVVGVDVWLSCREHVTDFVTTCNHCIIYRHRHDKFSSENSTTCLLSALNAICLRYVCNEK